MTVIDRISSYTLGGVYFMPSITDGLVGLFQPRRSAQEGAINRAPGGLNGKIVGNPSFGPWGALLGPLGFIDTQIPETSSFTLISIAKKNTLGDVMLIGTLAGSVSSTPYGLLAIRSSTPPRFVVGAKSTPTTPIENFGHDFLNDSPEMMVGACDGEYLTVSMPGKSPSDPDVLGGNPRTVPLNGVRDVSVGNWRIGAPSVTTSLYPNSTIHYCDMIFNRALSDLEIKAIYAESADYFRARGIVI